MIISYADRATRDLAAGRSPAEIQSFERVAIRKLVQLDAAVSLTDLALPPGNRLEYLKGNREGQWSIRINRQWRICFGWTDQGPIEVEIVDYH
jgi:proteic killer suppression protein